MNLKPLLLFLLMVTSASAQKTLLTGIIVDSKTNEAIPYATIGLINKNLFYRADENGKFDVTNKLNTTDTVSFSCIGYRTIKLTTEELPTDAIIRLLQLNKTLSEVIVGYKRPQLVN